MTGEYKQVENGHDRSCSSLNFAYVNKITHSGHAINANEEFEAHPDAFEKVMSGKVTAVGHAMLFHYRGVIESISFQEPACNKQDVKITVPLFE